MVDYVKSTNFASKDSLAIGNPLKIVKGTEIDTEFNNIATAVATKANSTDAQPVDPQLTTLAGMDSSRATFLAGTEGFGFRNRIINGDMRIDQRNAGASGTGTIYTVDRWFYNATLDTKGTWQQNAGAVTPPVGFTNYLGFTSNSAYSVPSTDAFAFTQIVEGLNISDLGWGTANARSITVSFWARSSLTGTFGGAIRNGSATPNRSYPFTYSIAAANTWEYKTVTIPGDTAGTWLTTNGAGLLLTFAFGVGSTYSGTAGSWSGSNFLSATGATSVVGTNGATFYITGVQLEAGSVATPFERRDYGRELMMCQRYFENDGGVQIVGDNIVSGSSTRAIWYYRVSKRAAATVTFGAGSNGSLESNSSTEFVRIVATTGTFPSFGGGATASSEL